MLDVVTMAERNAFHDVGRMKILGILRADMAFLLLGGSNGTCFCFRGLGCRAFFWRDEFAGSGSGGYLLLLLQSGSITTSSTAIRKFKTVALTLPWLRCQLICRRVAILDLSHWSHLGHWPSGHGQRHGYAQARATVNIEPWINVGVRTAFTTTEAVASSHLIYDAYMHPQSLLAACIDSAVEVIMRGS
jgi:hypothetical protein